MAALAMIATALLLNALWTPLSEVTDDLPPLPADVDVRRLVLPPTAGQPGLDLGDHAGRRVFLLVADARSAMSMSGFRLRNALMRWRYPPSVVGFEVASFDGVMGKMASMMEPMMTSMGGMSRFPMSVDTEGTLVDAFSLPAGHLGLVILGEQGEVLLRRSGAVDDEALAAIARLLRASEPPPPPPAPDVDWPSGIDGRPPIAVAFLGGTLREREVRGVSMFSMPTAMQDPTRRIVDQLDQRMAIPADVDIVVVGDLRGFADRDWHRVEHGPALRRAFEVPDGEPGLVVIDGDGRLAFRETGLIDMWKLGFAAEALGATPRPMWGAPSGVAPPDDDD